MNRRTRFWTFTFVMLVLALASLVFLNVIISRSPIRVDATATGEHQLSQRTQNLLQTLPADFSILIWANLSQVDTAAKQNVADVVSQFRSNTDRISISVADTGSTDGLQIFTSTLTTLAERDKEGIVTHGRQVQATSKAVVNFANVLDQNVAQQLEQLSTALLDQSARQALASRAQAVRTASKEFLKIAASAESLLATDAANTDASAKILRDGLTTPLAQFAAFVKEIGKLADASADEHVAASARELVKTLGSARDSVAAELEKLSKTPRPAIARVAEAIKAPRGVIVIGPANLGLVALDFDELFSGSSSGADRRRHAEDLFATALTTLSVPTKPIVVLTHAESQPLLTARSRLFDEMAGHLSRRGIDLVEYSAATQSTPPTPADLDPTHSRPIVFLVLSPDSTQPAGGPTDQPGAARAQSLGKALSTLAAQGASICLSINPSILPVSEQQDPVTVFALDFGLRIDSGRPLVTLSGPSGKQVALFDRVIQPAESAHAITSAVHNLPTFFGFAIPFERSKPTEGSIVEITDLYSVPNSDTTWAEHEWIGVWQTPANKRNELAPATFDPAKDSNRGPFPIACAVERIRENNVRQRLVYIGSNNWFADFVTQARETVDGRVVNSYAGNMELLEASILWLAHQENLISPAPASQAIAIIKPLTPGQINLLRIALIVVVPILVLLTGVLYRFIRG